MSSQRPLVIASRGSALAMAQSNLVLEHCRRAFPELAFEIKVFKTTGDKMQTAPPDLSGAAGIKGLFTKELEVALKELEADMAVHSLKDLPTDVPEGLVLGAVLPRADVRDVLIYRGEIGRGFGMHCTISDLPDGAVLGTGSTRRQAQALAMRPDLGFVAIRGNVGTRLQTLAAQSDLDGLLLAAAGLQRLGYQIDNDGQLCSSVAGLRATILSVDEMLPCVGQGAIGIETRQDDQKLQAICGRLNDLNTMRCVLAERAFLRAMGGGCLSPVAAFAKIIDEQIQLRAVSFSEGKVRRVELAGAADQPEALGTYAGEQLRP
jgi:hydroxymethylbilane synthase